jgi:hypothetical protein
MTDSRRRRSIRAESKEAYRLWFEFLRRAIAEDKSKVRLDLYKDWGDVERYKFEKWWAEIGQRVIEQRASVVELVEDGTAEPTSYLLRVPKSMTSTAIGNEVRNFLIGIGHQPLQMSSLRVRAGAEVRPVKYRSYIHTYDQYIKLAAKADGQKVTARELLKAVRKFYLDREKRYKNNLWPVDKLPAALATDLNRNDLNDIDPIHSATAINAVNRYLREAHKIIASVSEGRFPD